MSDYSKVSEFLDFIQRGCVFVDNKIYDYHKNEYLRGYELRSYGYRCFRVLCWGNDVGIELKVDLYGDVDIYIDYVKSYTLKQECQNMLL